MTTKKKEKKTIVRFFGVPRRSHRCYEDIVEARRALKKAGIEFEEASLEYMDDEAIDLHLLYGGGAHLPHIQVRQGGEVVKQCFGYDQEFIDNI